MSQVIDLFLHLDRHLDELTSACGGWTYAILFVIVCCETGLVFTPFLPGDSQLFAAGAVAALGGLDPAALFVLLAAAAILGDTANYWIGLLDSRRGTPSLQEKARNLLSALFKRAVQRKLIRETPMPPAPRRPREPNVRPGGAKNTRPKRILSDEQLGRLVDELAPRYRALVLLMARMGLRPGGAVPVTVGRFWPPVEAPEPARGRLVVSTAISGSTKTGEVRERVLPDAVSKILSDHIAAFSDPDDPQVPMFTTETGLTIGTRNRHVRWTRQHFTPAAIRVGDQRWLLTE